MNTLILLLIFGLTAVILISIERKRLNVTWRMAAEFCFGEWWLGVRSARVLLGAGAAHVALFYLAMTIWPLPAEGVWRASGSEQVKMWIYAYLLIAGLVGLYRGTLKVATFTRARKANLALVHPQSNKTTEKLP